MLAGLVADTRHASSSMPPLSWSLDLTKQLPHRKQTLVGNLMKNWYTIVGYYCFEDNTYLTYYWKQ